MNIYFLYLMVVSAAIIGIYGVCTLLAEWEAQQLDEEDEMVDPHRIEQEYPPHAQDLRS